MSALLVIFIILGAVFYVFHAVYGEHHCFYGECDVCTRMEAFRDVLRLITVAAVLGITVLQSGSFFRKYVGGACILRQTPVKLRVKITD